MTVAVCIVSFRSAMDVALCVAALERLTYPDFEIVVCENGGPSAFADLQKRLPKELAGGQSIMLVEAPGNIGYAGGCNLAMAQRPDAEAWWIVNPDAEPDPDALRALMARLAQGDVQAVGGSLIFPDGRTQGHGGVWSPYTGQTTSIDYGTRSAANAANVEAQQNYLLGASMLISRTFFSTVGPMREDYFLYCEEVEWFMRGAHRGMKLGFAPGARVVHRQGAITGSGRSVRDRPKLPIYLDDRNKLHLVRDTGGPPSAIMAVILALHALWKYPRKFAWRQLSYSLSGIVAGLRGERGVPRWLAR